jgi:DNA polymerase III psi subunit
MRELQGRWKQVALAPRTQGEALWRRFKTAQDAVFARTSAHLAAQNEERVQNLAKKQSLCEQAEALAASNEWVKTATSLQALQAEWKTIGPVSRGSEKAIWERFRAACDQFFSRRHDDLKKRKDEWSENLARKEALCARAEALATSTDWEAAAGECKKLQVEWKQIGPVRRSKSDAVWQRFRTACDAFFDRYKHRDQVDLQAKAAARADVIRDLEALATSDGAGDVPDGLVTKVQDARAKWSQAPELPRTVQQELAASYHQALGKIVAAWPAAFAGTDLDPETTRKRMEKLLAKVESLGRSSGAEAPAPASPAEMLAQRWRERLAANTMAGGQAVAHAEENRWREAEQEVRNAQSQWTRLGPVPADVAGPLNERFQRACRKFYDQRKK